MADRRRKPGSRRSSGGGGRVTPKGGTPVRKDPVQMAGRRRAIDPDTPVQVGRRPSSSGFLLLVGLMWLAVGVVMMVTLSATWRFVPGIVSLGIGLMFLRGAGATELRRERRRSSDQ